jgi:hypothetical protein
VLAAIALLIHRKWWPLAILPIGLLAWSIAGYTMDGPADRPWWKWLIDHWPYEAGSEYPRGPILFYLGVLPMVVGPFALPAMWIGAWQSIARTPNRSSGCTSGASPHTMDRLIAALPLCLLIGYSLLFWLGKFSSSGSPRYLLIVAPLWGCLAARGWQWVFDRMRWQRAASWAALAVVVPGVVNWIYPFLPLKQSASWSQAEKFVAWYQTSRFRNEFPRVMCNHPGIYFYSDRSPWDRRVVQPWAPEAIDRPVPDVVLVWDREFCTQNSDPKLVASLHRIANAGWVEDRAAEALSDVSFPNVPPKQLKWDHPDELKIFVAGR